MQNIKSKLSNNYKIIIQKYTIFLIFVVSKLFYINLPIHLIPNNIFKLIVLVLYLNNYYDKFIGNNLSNYEIKYFIFHNIN